MIRGATTTSDGVRIAWDRRGSGSPLVLIHGFTDYRALMEPLAERFAAEHDVINLDVRGHGDSERGEDLSFPRLSADVVDVCVDMGLESPVFVGHSIGGLLATGAASGAGARAVVNIDQSLDLDRTARRIAPVAGALRDPSRFHAMLDALFSGEVTPGLAPQVQAALDRCAWDIAPEVVLGIWAELLDGPSARVRAWIEEQLTAQTAPYLLMLGATPEAAYATWLGAKIRNLTLEVLPGAGHFLHLANPDRVVASVRRLVAGCP